MKNPAQSEGYVLVVINAKLKPFQHYGYGNLAIWGWSNHLKWLEVEKLQFSTLNY
jgi:hypothetical protein